MARADYRLERGYENCQKRIYNGDNAIAYDICKHCMASFKHWFTIKDDDDE